MSASKKASRAPEKSFRTWSALDGACSILRNLGGKIKVPRAPGRLASLLEAADERKQESIPRA